MSRLVARGLTKRYGTAAVLRSVDFEVRAGEIHALLGANGAGKSTLCKILAGLVPASAGEMRLEGHEFAPGNKRDAERQGVQMVQQELNLISTLSVAENLLLTSMPTRGIGWIAQREMRQQAAAILHRYGLDGLSPDAAAGGLGIGQQQMLEVAAALAKGGKVLLLDEPTASLSGAEAERLFGWLEELRDEGVAVVYVSHRLTEVARLADRITVLRDGELVATEEARGMQPDDMVAWMSGEESGQEATGDRRAVQSSRGRGFSVRGMSSGIVRDVSFDVTSGERLGIAGLVGCGRTALLRAIFGADRAETGSVQVGSGRPARFSSPYEGSRAGLAFVTEDRKLDGLLLGQPLRWSVTLSTLSQCCARYGVVSGSAERRVVEEQVEALDIRCTSIEQEAGTLSGGNQQKVAVAKWLLGEAQVFLFDEPTRGIDVTARHRLYELFEVLAESGKCLVIASSDTEELIEVCDRIAVMSNGRIVETFERNEFSEDAILEAAFSGYVHARSPEESPGDA